MPKTSVTIQLPNPVPKVVLPPHLAVPLRVLMSAGPDGVTTPMLQMAGCLRPANAVFKLRKLGAVIEMQRCGASDYQGKIHKGVARYVYKWWEPATPGSDSINKQKETKQ